ncbi:hypothetical protein PILCRDRAFT_711445 [Piloderma croceum F 1598]|uniref:Uncharacterized protein n=1 Tax=Piloderma croceum (strain F 1598) TaxID=765440 RepID=A0A0C3F2R8_PILCF|nr:hypothetical protein PILCRDRAFT_711445 [Piloderma croceum F 1598]
MRYHARASRLAFVSRRKGHRRCRLMSRLRTIAEETKFTPRSIGHVSLRGDTRLESICHASDVISEEGMLRSVYQLARSLPVDPQRLHMIVQLSTVEHLFSFSSLNIRELGTRVTLSPKFDAVQLDSARMWTFTNAFGRKEEMKTPVCHSGLSCF